jgi:hypothetical protein
MMNMKSSDAFWNTVKSREAFLENCRAESEERIRQSRIKCATRHDRVMSIVVVVGILLVVASACNI